MVTFIPPYMGEEIKSFTIAESCALLPAPMTMPPV